MGINQPTGFDITPLWFKGIQIAATVFSGMEKYKGEITNTFDIAMDLVTQYGLPAKELVTHKYRLEEHRKAFDTLAYRTTSKAVKVVFQHVV